MKSLIILLFVAGALHLGLHIPVIAAVIGVLVLWVLWKLKWVLLGILGLEMLFGGGDNNNGGGGFDV
jgi:putative effector of murein hydrolase LrgA (UPF0299 family)